MNHSLTETDPRITSIRPTRSDPLRYSIKVGRKRVATLSVERVDRLGLRVGMAWDGELAERVDAEAAADKVRRDALRTVGRRMIGTEELRQRLRRKGHGDASIDHALEKLTEQGLLDDAAYGRAVIEQARLGKPAGRRLLHHKLMRKKLPRDLIPRLLDEAEAGADPAADARRLAERKLATTTMRTADPPARRRRLWSLLARRGFDPETIRNALEGLPGLWEDEVEE